MSFLESLRQDLDPTHHTTTTHDSALERMITSEPLVISFTLHLTYHITF